MALKLHAGFTLVELLIVIAILAILSTLGLNSFQTAKIKAKDLERKSNLAAIAKSLEAYTSDHRKYPLSDSNGKIICQSGNVVCNWGSALTDGTTTYMVELPVDSNVSLSYRYESASGTSYTLYARLENTQDPAINPAIPSNILCGSAACNYKITSSNTQ